MKIISLVPSITETLFDFGLSEKEIVGRTKFCIHPENSVKKIAVVGGTKSLHIKKIKALNPDLIIANKEENEKIQIEELAKDFEVWITDISTIKDNEAFLKDLGERLQKVEFADKYSEKIRQVLDSSKILKPVETAYLIWKDPYMTVGNDTFISSVITAIGLKNIFENQSRYPVIEMAELEQAELILLSSEPYPFKQKHVEEIRHNFPEKKIILADGEAFSWYGTHIARRKIYFEKLLNQITSTEF